MCIAIATYKWYKVHACHNNYDTHIIITPAKEGL